MARMESQIGELTARIYAQEHRPAVQPQAAMPPVAPPPPPEPPPVRVIAPVVVPPHVEPPRVQPPPIALPIPQPAPAPRTATLNATRDWEAILGGNWLNKIGVFVLVVGLALLLSYSFTQFGPLGRVAICLAASLSLLAAGAILESKERYRMFARGLLGGGWAALYVTVYAMHAVEAARVIESPVGGAILLLTVATGMIVHSLRYRSQTVTGLAYFVAFGTLAITDMSIVCPSWRWSRWRLRCCTWRTAFAGRGWRCWG